MVEMDNIPFAGKPIKAAYMWRDIERRAARYGLPFAKPSVYPVDPELVANRVGVVAAEQGWCSEYTKASYEAWFLRDKAIGFDDNIEKVLSSIGKDADQVLDLANSDETKSRFSEETDVARQMGVFGSPTFAVDDEIFWGDDRLEDVLEWISTGSPSNA